MALSCTTVASGGQAPAACRVHDFAKPTIESAVGLAHQGYCQQAVTGRSERPQIGWDPSAPVSQSAYSPRVVPDLPFCVAAWRGGAWTAVALWPQKVDLEA